MRYSRKVMAVAAVAFWLLTAPALACSSSVDDLGPEIYCGKYRGDVKTSFYTTPDGRLGTFFHYETLADLLDALPTDEDMRASTVWSLAGAPAVRLVDEQVNVEVPAYIVAVKPGEDDHDLHVIVSDQPRGRNRVFMNVEVSGLPRNGVRVADFARARAEIRAILADVDDPSAGSSYIRIDPPPPVLVQGSLFFDGDHRAGCGNCPGPAFAKPSTVWEIHPVYSIRLMQ